mgnify:CR=1 FL=1
MTDFHGTKLAILSRGLIVTILRDDIPSIPWPGYWDFPGGGRENGESPEACVLRETLEELGLRFTATDLSWRQEGSTITGEHVWFFVTEQPEFDPETVCFGHEGQEWRLAPISWYLAQEKVVPHQRQFLLTYLESR